MRGTELGMARHRAEAYGTIVKRNMETAMREAGLEPPATERHLTLTGLVRVAGLLKKDPCGWLPSPGEVDSARSAARSQGHCPDAR